MEFPSDDLFFYASPIMSLIPIEICLERCFVILSIVLTILTLMFNMTGIIGGACKTLEGKVCMRSWDMDEYGDDLYRNKLRI